MLQQNAKASFQGIGYQPGKSLTLVPQPELEREHVRIRGLPSHRRYLNQIQRDSSSGDHHRDRQ